MNIHSVIAVLLLALALPAGAVTTTKPITLHSGSGTGAVLGLPHATMDLCVAEAAKRKLSSFVCKTAGTWKADPPSAWKQCATQEGAMCVFTGSHRVRYGANGTYALIQTFVDGVTCSYLVFGDPVFGTPKTCEYELAAAPAPPPPGAGQAPTPVSIAGKLVVGRIDAVSGQIIENVRVTTTHGPCIVIDGKTNVTIRNSEIGPCGSVSRSLNNEGVFISNSSNITIQRNVIHDVSTGMFAANSQHPIVFDRNFVYNVRGPMWQGQVTQFNNVRNGSGQSKITCNVSDDRYGNDSNVEDHFNAFNSKGLSASQPIEFAYNRVRGSLGQNRKNSESGSGFQTGDGEGDQGNIWIHHNTVVRSNGTGASISGGTHIIVEDNRFEQNGPDLASYTGWAYTISNFNTAFSCGGHEFNRNRGIGRLWAYNHDGSPATSLFDRGQCGVTAAGNNFGDTSLTPAIFDEPYAQCN